MKAPKVLNYLSVTLAFSVLIPIQAADDYCYDDPSCGPSTWGGDCQRGDKQSPIDLPATSFQSGLTVLRFGVYLGSNFRLTNNGHQLYFDFVGKSGENEGPTNQPIPFPDPQQVNNLDFLEQNHRNYKFHQAHLHWGPNDTVGSDHTVAGRSSAMELHLVHYLANYSNIQEALEKGDDNAIAVLGVLIDADSDDNNHFSPFFPLLKYVKEVRKPGTAYSETEGKLDLTSLFYSRRPQVYAYKGSLTTPTCIQKVNWYVLKTPATIPKREIAAFRTSLLDSRNQEMKSNYRPVQERNKREVLLVDVSSP